MTYRADTLDPEEDYSQPPCRRACPVGTDARSYVQAIADGDFRGAYEIARAPNPLASVCAFVCGAPCERSCRRRRLDQPVAIRALKRAAYERGANGTPLDREKLVALRERHLAADLLARADTFSDRARPCPGRIAIIGSGPAGLACAHDLALLGAAVTVVEADEQAAGLLVQGIPAYRLPREIVEREVAFIVSLGVELRVGTEVGVDVSLKALINDYDAVVLATGARRSRILPLPGVEGPGVLGGLEFLRAVHKGEPPLLGNQVVVVGAGNVAFDVARSALRRFRSDVSVVASAQPGVSNVVLVCLEAPDEMPADEVEVLEGEEEGIDIRHRLGPHRVIRDEDGKVTALECRRVERVFDDQGRFAPIYTEEIEVVPADTILFAVGQAYDLGFARDVDGLDLDEHGAPILRAPNRTTHETIWVAGDLERGPGLAIDAIASGRRAAIEIHKHLTGEELAPTPHLVLRRLENFVRSYDYESRPRGQLPVLPPRERLQSETAVVEQSVSPDWAQQEAGRCLDCTVQTVFDAARCVLCGGCVDICPMACFRLVPLSSVEVAGNAVDAKEWSALLKDDDRCIRCGLCAARCPDEALTMQRAILE